MCYRFSGQLRRWVNKLSALIDYWVEDSVQLVYSVTVVVQYSPRSQGSLVARIAGKSKDPSRAG